MTTVFVPKESRSGETRVALSPESAKRLVQSKVTLTFESGAGDCAGFPDAVFEALGARKCGPDGWGTADLVLKVAPPTAEEAARLKRGRGAGLLRAALHAT